MRVEADLLQRATHARDHVGVHELAGDVQCQRHVLEHGAVRQQAEVLVDHADRATQQGT